MSERSDQTLPPDESKEDVNPGPVHGGEGDPLGEGVADADDTGRSPARGDKPDSDAPRPTA